MGRRGTEKRAMKCEVLVRLNDELACMLKNSARATGSTQAAVVRDVLRAHFGGSTPGPVRTDVHADVLQANAELCAALASAGTAVGRLTGILVQLAKAIRESRASAVLHAEIEQTREDAVSTLASIRDLLKEVQK